MTSQNSDPVFKPGKFRTGQTPEDPDCKCMVLQKYTDSDCTSSDTRVGGVDFRSLSDSEFDTWYNVSILGEQSELS